MINIENVGSNMSKPALIEIVRAIEANEVTWDPKNTSMYAESCAGYFAYKGYLYIIEEFWEEVRYIGRVECLN